MRFHKPELIDVAVPLNKEQKMLNIDIDEQKQGAVLSVEGQLAEHIANHFVAAEIKGFGYDHLGLAIE